MAESLKSSNGPRRTVRRRWPLRVAIGVVLVAIIVVASLPRATPVAAVKLERATMRVEIDGEGRTRLRDAYTVAAPVTGELERITLRVGDTVRRGDVIARLRPPARDAAQLEELRRRVEAAAHAQGQAREIERQASIAVEAARREVTRLVPLKQTGAVASAEVDAADDRLAMAVRDLESARHRSAAASAEVEAIRASIVAVNSTRGGSVVVRAPADGTILRVVEPSGRTVPAGTPLVVLGDPGKIEVVVDLLSSDAVRVTPGDRVRLDGWGGERELTARVRYVEPVGITKISALGVEEQRVDVVADLVTAAPQLGDGYRVESHIVVWERAGVLGAPTSALFRDGRDWALFVVRDGRAVRAKVRIGQRTPFTTEILEGVKEGEKVIPFPSDRIEDGMRVEDEGDGGDRGDRGDRG